LSAKVACQNTWWPKGEDNEKKPPNRVETSTKVPSEVADKWKKKG